MQISLNNLLFTLLLLTSLLSSSTSKPFKCTTAPICKALIDYKTKNSTTLSSIETLFSIKNLRTLLGANNLDFNTTKNYTITAETTIKIPFTCICQNGTGISNKKPVYTVQPGDGLDHIARDIFSELVTYPEIAEVNNIKDVNLIEVGQNLTIPLPCSCDDVNGEKVVHYGYVVESGSTLESIAGKFGTTADILSTLNNVNDSSLLANQLLDVPLKACNSSVSPSSSDYPLLVPNGTYVFTANSCVKCKCNSANNWTLQCEPSGRTPLNSTWNTCRSMQCTDSNLFLGNTTTAGCNTTTCAYSGFNNQNILTTLASLSTCPVPGNYASSSISLSWKFILISLHLVMLFVYPL